MMTTEEKQQCPFYISAGNIENNCWIGAPVECVVQKNEPCPRLVKLLVQVAKEASTKRYKKNVNQPKIKRKFQKMLICMAKVWCEEE